MKKINIAIDGYSSCGKSTVAKAIAKRMNYIFVDTGAMYRAVTLFAMRNHFFVDQELDAQLLVQALPQIELDFEFNTETQSSDILLNGENVERTIRTMEVSSNVSPVATVKEVRKKLVAQQQKMGEKKGVVMDGRDIGTVVFPNAELKLFMTADPEVRAQRRFLELQQKNMETSIEEVRKNLEERDHIDTNREEDPLRQAIDAVVIDNSNLSPDEQMAMVMALIDARLKNTPN